MLFVCPRCQDRAGAPNYAVDFVHTCPEEDALDKEDVLDITGDNPTFKGVANKLFGTRAQVEGERQVARTDLGNKKPLVKTQRHKEYIDLRNKRGFFASKNKSFR